MGRRLEKNEAEKNRLQTEEALFCHAKEFEIYPEGQCES